MYDDRDDPDEEQEGLELSGFMTECSGCFGSATWVVGKRLYDVLPRDKRDGLLAMTADRKIEPFFTETTERLLRQAGCSTDTSCLDNSWSFHDREVRCCFGQVTWQIGEGLWDTIPEDQRDTLLEVADVLIRQFFHLGILEPLQHYALRKLIG